MYTGKKKALRYLYTIIKPYYNVCTWEGDSHITGINAWAMHINIHYTSMLNFKFNLKYYLDNSQHSGFIKYFLSLYVTYLYFVMMGWYL